MLINEIEITEILISTLYFIVLYTIYYYSIHKVFDLILLKNVLITTLCLFFALLLYKVSTNYMNYFNILS